MKAQEIILDESRNVTLTAYIQEVDGEFGFSKRPAMLVIPGGGYAMCSDREADPVALAYLKAGFQAFVLRYTCTPKGKWPLPLEDYEQAMALIEEHADEWHLDKSRIAVVGFSAGGHLAACAATVAQHKPAAAVLVYPAILKDICDLCQPGMPYPNEHVTAQTCPCFLVAARDDRTVNISNTLRMELALTEKGIAFESHIYSYGGHGFSTGEDWINTNFVCPRLPRWVPDSIEWLGEVMGKLTRGGFTEPVSAGSMNSNFAPVLSVDCTLSHLRKQSEAAQTVLAPMYAAIEAVAKARQFSVEGLMAAVGNNTAREIMEMVQIPAETITAIDRALHQMVNEPEG
ncbi:MAG: alpha/beta hydrolase [Clostridia bacterium]|nr:alpha/beta hydrolase [Clostridia bacterium]